MASEDNDGGVSFALPADVGDWVAETADRRDESRDEICRRIITAVHAVTADSDRDYDQNRERGGTSEFATAGDIDDLKSELEERLEAELDDQHEEFMNLLEDVRARVIQVKRETDAKAPAEHDHAAYAAEEDLESLREAVEELEGTVDAGFENFEEVLDYLFDRTDRLEERSTVLATAVVDLRDRWDQFAERERRRAEAEQLQLAANQLGIRSAACEDCGADVDIALLSVPECPHCTSSFADVAERTSFFGSHTLETGDPPALEGRAERETRSTGEAAVYEEIEADADADAETDGQERNLTMEANDD